MLKLSVSTLGALLLAANVAAQTVVVPDPAVIAGGGNSGNIWRAGINRVQCFYDSTNFLNQAVGQPITISGLEWRAIAAVAVGWRRHLGRDRVGRVGLTGGRVRQIAARVVAVHQMVEGRSFRSVHRALCDAGFSATEAFSIAMRVYRAGGLTKDAVYLRGLSDLVTHVGSGRSLDVLWLGKMALSSAPLVEELWLSGALIAPLIRPLYLDDSEVQDRITSLGHMTSLADLLVGSS